MKKTYTEPEFELAFVTFERILDSSQITIEDDAQYGDED